MTSVFSQGTHWRRVHARQFGVAIDGAEYFSALDDVFRRARRSIFIIGWEFDSRIRLIRDPLSHAQEEIGSLLDYLVRTRPDLRIFILIWDSAFIYAFNREFAGSVKMEWLTHSRLRFCLDDTHPFGASHHQKIVVVDDAIGFVGGIDISSQRWDSRSHCRIDPRRNDPGALKYPPFHDIMGVVTGEAARTLGDICRERWRRATGEEVPPPPLAVTNAEDLWPRPLRVLMREVEVAIARTVPPWDTEPPVHEVEQLYLEMIAAAQRFIYIENQYFTSRRIADAIAARLKERTSPEIILIMPGPTENVVERSTMERPRHRLIERLRALDHGENLHLYAPMIEGETIKIHAKLMIVDDEWLRIGSSNLNNRSMGLDSECDLLITAKGDPSLISAIRGLRQDLLAEHLGMSLSEISAAEEATGSLRATITRLRGRSPNTLVPLSDPGSQGIIIPLIADSPLPDPEETVESLVCRIEDAPALQRQPWGLGFCVMSVVVLSALWALAPPEWLRLAGPWLGWLSDLRERTEILFLAAALSGAAFLVAGIARLPVFLVVAITAALLGPWTGGSISLAGTLTSAVLLYLFGRSAGRARVRRLLGWKSRRVECALARRGFLAMILLRLMPVATFPVVNLVAGASRTPFLWFVVGTALGMSPGILALSLLGDRIATVLQQPSTANVVTLALIAAVIVAAQFALAERLLRAGRASRYP